MGVGSVNVASHMLELLDHEAVQQGTCSILFKDGEKNQYKIYLKKGDVYAVDNLAYEKNLWQQLHFNGLLKHGNLRSLMRSHKTQRESLYKLLKKARSRRDEPATIYVLQEYTLGALDNLYQASNVTVEIIIGDVNKNDSADIPPFPLQQLNSMIASRAQHQYTLYERWGFKDDLQFGNAEIFIDLENDPNEDETSNLEYAMLSARQFHPKNVQNTTGYSLFTIASVTEDLEEAYALTIKNPHGRHKAIEPAVPEITPTVTEKHLFAELGETPAETVQAFKAELRLVKPTITIENMANFVDDESEDAKEFDANFERLLAEQAAELQDYPPLPTTPIVIPAIIPAEVLAGEEVAGDLYASMSVAPFTKPTLQEAPAEAPKAALGAAGASGLLGLLQRVQEELKAKEEYANSFADKRAALKKEEAAATKQLAALKKELTALTKQETELETTYNDALTRFTKLA